MRLKGKRTLIPFLIFLGLFWSGCGIRLWKGSDSGGQPQSGGSGGIALKIIWPSEGGTRLIPTATKSVKVEIIKVTNILLTDVIPRQEGQSEVSRRYENLPVGSITVRVSAYSSTDGTGVALAKGQVDVDIQLNTYAPVSITMASTITTVEVTPNPATISVGEQLQMTATAKDEAGNIVMVPEGGFSWESSNPGVASVDSNGLVTGLAEGSAVITATEKESGKSGSADISVTQLPQVITFERTFGGAYEDCGESVQETRDGGYIIAGWTESFGAGGKDVYLIKTDSQGNKLWERTFGGADDDWGYSVRETRDGGFIIVGRTHSFGVGGFDVYLVRTDSQGNKLWERTFGGADDDWGESVQETRDGGYIIAGRTKSFGAGEFDVYLIKTDSQGNKLWERTFGGRDDDDGYSDQETHDGGFIIAGETYSFGAGWIDVYLIKTDSQGNKLWERTFGGWAADFGYSVQEMSDGGYIITGGTDSFGAGNDDIYLLKTDSQGNKIWERTFGGWDWDCGFSVQETRDGGFIIAGWTCSFGAGGGDVYLIKTDSQGNKIWERTFGGRDDDDGYSVQETRDGGYIIAGWTRSFGLGGKDVYLIKTDSHGLVSTKGRLSLSRKSVNSAGNVFKNVNSRCTPDDRRCCPLGRVKFENGNLRRPPHP